MSRLVAALSVSVFALLSTVVVGQQCGFCGNLTDIATKTTWYKNSTDQQRDYFNLLDKLDKGYDEFKKAVDGSGNVDWLFDTASANFNNDYYERHEKEIRERIETRLQDSYKNTTYVQYPESLINTIASCHKLCLGNTAVMCHAISTDQATVVFDVELYRAQNDDRTFKFSRDITLPQGVQYLETKTQKIPVANSRLKVGPNLFQLDRKGRKDGFTVTCGTTLEDCSDSVPEAAKQPEVPLYKTFCDADAGFAAKGEDYQQHYTCHNMQPGARFVATFSGRVHTDVHSEQSWTTLRLSSNESDDSTSEETVLDVHPDNYTNLILVGTVPGVDDALKHLSRGDVSVALTMPVCQWGGGLKPGCSTLGPAHITIVAGTP